MSSPSWRVRSGRVAARLLTASSIALTLAAPTQASAATSEVSGWALLGPQQRIAGARIDVRTERGRSLLTPGQPTVRTTINGTFHASVVDLPKRYVVVATGGTVAGRALDGRFSQLMTPNVPSHLAYVSPISSIIHARAARTGSLIRAERDVRRLTGHPLGLSLYASVRAESDAFDGLRFLRSARRNGGINRYIATLAAREPARRVSFRSGRPARRAAAGNAAEAQVGAAAAQWVADRVGGAVANYAVGQALSFFGLGSSGDSAEFAAIARQLDAIKGELDESLHQLSEIQQEIAKLDDDVLQSEYSQLTQGLKLTYLGNLDDTQGSIDPALESLHLLVDDLHAGTTAPAGGLAPCAADVRQCLVKLDAGTPSIPSFCTNRANNPAPAPADPSLGWTTADKVASDVCRLWNAVHGIDTDDANEFQNGLIGTHDSDGVIVALLKARAARLRTDHQMVTSSYYENYKKIGDHLAFQTALLATYRAMNSVMTNDAGYAPVHLQHAAAYITTQASKAPKRVPDLAFANPNTGDLWRLADDTSDGCKVAASPYLLRWGSSFGVPACPLFAITDAASETGLTGFVMPQVKDFASILEVWQASKETRLDTWLHTSAGLPDLSNLATEVPTPEGLVNSSVFQRYVAGAPWAKVKPNAGSTASLGTISCQHEVVNWPQLPTGTSSNFMRHPLDASFCTIIRMQDGAQVPYCVKAKYDDMPCGMPAVWRMDPYAYLHPSVWLLRRAPAPGDRWFVS